MFLWFGDSFTIGHELQVSSGRKYCPVEFAPNAGSDCDPVNAYPAIVSRNLGHDHYNYAAPGASIHFALHELTRIHRHQLHADEKDVTVFLSHTGELRRFGLDLDHQPVHTGAHLPNIVHQPRSDVYYNRDNFCLYDYTIALNHFYLLTKDLGWRFYHYPIWYQATLYDEMCIVDENCLIPIEIDKYYNNSNKYIAEGTCHPNVAGHKFFAKDLITLLSSKKFILCHD
jgi:hypothetical protein